MGWQDTARLLNGVLAHSPSSFRGQGYQTFEQRYRPRQDVFRTNRPASQRINWSDFATGRLAAAPAAPRGQAGFPERINVELPYSSSGSRSPYEPPPAGAPASTQGDLIASIGGAGESMIKNINLGNFVPYFQERLTVLAGDLAEADIPVVSDVARVARAPLDLFIDGVEAVMKPVGEIEASLPDWIRDSQLKDRAKLYRAIANGEAPDFGPTGPVSNPLATALQLASTIAAPIASNVRAQMGESVNPLAGLTGQTVSEQAWQAQQWQRELLHAVDPNRRLLAEQRLAILRESIDLPESVKLLLERNPRATDDEVARWIDEAPEGKQWSYMPGAPGILQNVGTSLGLFLIEARAGYGLGRGIGAFGGATGGAAGTAISAAGQGIALTAKLQTAAMAAGIAVTPLTLTMSTIARYQGADEAIAWWDNANRSTDFSDDPMVQLATGFAVNPFRAVNLATRGVAGKVIAPLKHGLVEVPLDKLTGNRLQRFYTSDDRMLDMTRRMFKLGSREEASVFLDEQGLRETAHDMVVGNALDVVLDRLPAEERIAWNALYPDPMERAGATLGRWGEQALDLIEKEPDLVAARFYDYDWNRRMMLGDFTPERAALIARSFRDNVDLTYDLRREQNLVVGYREAFPPRAQSLARSALDRVTKADGTVTIGDVQDLQVDFPVLGRFWAGILKGGPTTMRIPRADVDRVLEAAALDWAHKAKINPKGTATGIDPVLRPSSPTLQRDYAEAVGTNIDTIAALRDFDPKSATHADLLRRLLVDKTDLAPAAANALTPQQAYERAAAYFETTTKPWTERGTRIEAAETQMTRLRSELARVRREGDATESDRTIRIRREINELADLIRTAGDPIATFASGAPRTAGLMDSHLAELAARKVDAMERLRVIQTVTDDLSAASIDETTLGLVVTGADGELAWAFDLLRAPPTPVLDAYLAYRTAAMHVTRSVKGELTSRRQQERVLSNKGQELIRYTEAAPGSYQWAQIASSPGFVKRLRQIGDRPAFYSEMTGNQMADIIDAAGLARGVSGAPLDDIAAAWGIDRDAALTRLAGLKEARERALDGKGVSAVKRTAGIKVSDDYVAQAEADRVARELVYDAEYDAFWHPRNVAKVQEITGKPDELYPGLRAAVEGDAALEAGIANVAARTGASVDDVLTDPVHAAAVRAELVPADFEAPVEGLVREWTDLDYLITAGDAEGIAALSEQIATARAAPRPPVQVSETVARGLAQMPKKRRSYNYRRQISDRDGDFKAPPNAAILAEPANRTGVEVLSVLNHGITGTKPATVDGVIALLRDIEDGAATRMGVGPELQAEAQRVARALLDDAVKASKRTPETAGIGAAGFFPEDEQALAATLEDLISLSDANPMGTLQYGLKKAPKDAVVMEWSQVPGLAEELMSRRFAPWQERVGTAHIRQSFNWVFGPTSNATIRAETRNRFLTRLTTRGVSQDTAAAIWDHWYEIAHDSRAFKFLGRDPATGARRYVQGDWATYAQPWNIPNNRLNGEIHGSAGHRAPGVLAELQRTGRISTAEYAVARTIDYATEFREASSFIRRALADSKVPLGKALAGAYGLAMHNSVATTFYYTYRFAMDIRYHAMNYLEAQILYAGRAGLRKGEIDEGLLGQSESYLRNLDLDQTSNHGYPFSRERHHWAYRTFVKEQPEELRRALRGLASEDPALIRKAMEQLAESDPRLKDMVDAMGATPEKYLKELDAWHRKMLNNVDEADDAAVIDADLAAAMRDSPELAEVFDRLGQVNKDWWANVRDTFYGNASRSRAERFLNHYLLFWPLSYQIKSTKWFLRVLFDRTGGLPTNAAGAVVLDRLADTHNRLLATDPDYRDWFEKHDTLVFVAQMMFPVSFGDTGVSLSPPMRAVFFERDLLRAADIGPVYTVSLLKRIRDEIEVDLFPTVSDYAAARP